MGHHKKRSRSRDRSSERTSKRIRKLEDQMGVIAASLDVIQQAILARDALTPELPETRDLNLLNNEGTADQTDDSALTGQGTQPPGTQVVPETLTKVPENGNTKENEAPIDNAAKTAASTSEVAKEPESETPWELDENGLRIFGEEPIGNEPELILHSSISNRWKKYLSDGLKKEVKDSLLDKYPRKGKLSFEPPILNEEVTVNLKDSALKRDKYFCLTQKLAGSALSALAPVIESLVPSKEPENVGRLEKVWDAAKLLIEIHRSQTVARKACILPTLSKQWATALEKRTTDSYLFGEKLVDKVKEIKAIGKVGDEMKPSLPKKTFAPPNPLNWKSSSSQKKPVSQASGKISIPKKPPTSKFQSKQSTYPKSNQYRHQNNRFQNH